MRLKSWLAAAACVGVGLTANGPTMQTHAAGATTAIATIVPTDLDTTWQVLLQGLETGDFTINASIKASSTIRVLLQSKIPSTWVDCGSVSVDSKHRVFGDRHYDFLAANSVRYMVADETVDELIDVERRTSLSAMATIKLAEVREGTLVHVDAQYVMKFKTREFGKKFTPRQFDAHIDFDSAGAASLAEEIREGATLKSVDLTCRPTGELERHIVSVIAVPMS